MYSKGYILRFAASVTIVCSVLLASAATLLKPRQEANVEHDIKMNILKAVKLINPNEKHDKMAMLKLFDEKMTSIVVDTVGKVIPGLKAEDVNPEEEPDHLPIYLLKEGGKVIAYCIPIEGHGLWSTIKGYLALESDLNTVRGITFYSHGETPGLGGEISKEWFQENFVGKKILNETGDLVSITIVKGKLRPDAKSKEHKVDGISGASLTGKGVTNFLGENLKRYNPYFSKQRNQARNEVIS